MAIYEISIITNTGFPYYQLKLKEVPEGVRLHLRFFDFSSDIFGPDFNLDPTSMFELNAGLVSALYEFARNLNKKIENLEFYTNSYKREAKTRKFKGDVLITAQTECYLLPKSVVEKINIIYNNIIIPKIPLDSALGLLQNEEDFIIAILNDQEARMRIQDKHKQLDNAGNEFLKNMKSYGLNAICICSFDLSPLFIIGEKYDLNQIHLILRNIGIFPEISPLEWIYRQSNIAEESVWIYIIKSGVGITIDGVFQPYFYLLIADPQSYLGEFPSKITAKFNQIIG
jgi:hypothetical protein